MSETDKTYNWIRNVIMSCTNTIHIELCGILITFYEKKNPEPYLIKNLRESLNLKVTMINQKAKDDDENIPKDKVLEVFLSGHTVVETSKKLNIPLHICQKIVNDYASKNYHP